MEEKITHLNWGGLYGTLCIVIENSLLSNPCRKGRIEHTEVSSSHSTEETCENKQRKGLDGRDKTDTIYLILEDSSCSKEVTYLRVGWKLIVKDKNA